MVTTSTVSSPHLSVNSDSGSHDTILDVPRARGNTTNGDPTSNLNTSAGISSTPNTIGATDATAVRGGGDAHDVDQKNDWEICLEYAQEHVKQEVEPWKDEIHHLLTFATLFSGVSGAFAVQSYHSVKPDPADMTVLLLKTLVALQLNATNPQPNLPIDLNPQIPISAAARRINIYHFLSLVMGLTVVMVGITCLQWLRHYAQDPSLVPLSRREHLGVYVMRSEGMEKWHVFTILKALPLMLLLSVLVFFVGIIELLLEADMKAAIIISTVIFLACIFLVITTILPTVQVALTRLPWHIKLPHCPYKSPQAWVFYRFAEHVILKLFRLAWLIPHKTCKWPDYDRVLYLNLADRGHPHSNTASGIFWLGSMYLHNERLAEAFYGYLKQKSTKLFSSLYWILQRRDPRRAESIGRALKWSPPKAEEETSSAAGESHVDDVTIFQTLAHLIEGNEGGQPSPVLLSKRLELFIRICRTRLDKDIDCPLLGIRDMEVEISRDILRDALQCIFNLMQNASVNETHLRAIRDILELESRAPHPDIKLFDDSTKAVEGWIERQFFDLMNRFQGEDERSSIENLTLKVWSHINALREDVRSKVRGPSDTKEG